MRKVLTYMQITFLGATQTVTGSKFLLSFGEHKVLIDCGLFQGLKKLRLRNWAPFPIDPKSIHTVILTHAHIDHAGYLPLLMKNGFRGKIYATPGTKDLCSILLPDCGHLFEEEANYANRHGYSKHRPALPLYTKDDAFKVLKQFCTIPFGKSINLFENFNFQFKHAGHILGASFIEIEYKNKVIVFSGDMGRFQDLVMRPPENITDADYLILESTYGNRAHDTGDPIKKLTEIINKTVKRGGTIIIPAFAVGRAQSILYLLYKIKQTKTISNIPIFLDSPMAINSTRIFCQYKDEYRMSEEECHEFEKIAKYINTIEDSKSLDINRLPKIIISASGMVTGGRVLFHIKSYGQDDKNTIIFTGYQSLETRGKRIIDGEREIKMLGEMIQIRAEIQVIDNISAHADYTEILNWLENFKRPPSKVFLVHGEKGSRISFKNKIEERFGWHCELPLYQQSFNL